MPSPASYRVEQSEAQVWKVWQKVTSSRRAGSLVVVGTGIRLGQITPESLGALQSADVVLTIVGDPVTFAYLLTNCKKIENLQSLYQLGQVRTQTYRDMVNQVLGHVRQGKRVCFAVYGHPGVLCTPAHEAIALVREEGFAASMLPGIAADACLFADLGIDIGNQGVQSYEATSFLIFHKTWDPTTPLILWQIGVVGDPFHSEDSPNNGLTYLVDKLLERYKSEQEVTIYEAPTLPFAPPRADRILLTDLLKASLGSATTLVVLPAINAAPDLVLRDKMAPQSISSV